MQMSEVPFQFMQEVEQLAAKASEYKAHSFMDAARLVYLRAYVLAAYAAENSEIEPQRSYYYQRALELGLQAEPLVAKVTLFKFASKMTPNFFGKSDPSAVAFVMDCLKKLTNEVPASEIYGADYE